MLNSVQCATCKHLGKNRKRKCQAFDYIPTNILKGEFDHRQPYPGDNGVQFEPIDEATETDQQ
jgi:hypothetical protein